MKAQASLELLVLLAAFLSVLAILIPLENSIREKVVLAAQDSSAKSTLNAIANAADAVYLLGTGNSRDINTENLAGKSLIVSSNQLSIQGNGKELIRAGKFQAQEGEIALNKQLFISCCSESKITFSTSSP